MSRSKKFHRCLDKFIGPIIVRLLVIFKSKRKMPVAECIKRIGVFQPTAIGDAVMCLGLLDEFRINFPNSQQIIFCSQANSSVFLNLYPNKNFHVVVCNFLSPIKTLIKINNQKVDLLVDLCPWSFITAIYSFFSNAKYTVGFAPKGIKRHGVYDLPIEHRCDIHEFDNLNLLRSHICDGSYIKRQLNLIEVNPNIAINFDNLVLLHTCAGGSQAKAKQWPVSSWVKLAQMLSENGFEILFTGVKADQNYISEIVNQLKARGISSISLAGMLTLEQLVFIVRRALIAITVDTSVLHIAVAINARVIGLHGPTLSKRWGATNEYGCSIDAPHSSAGYINFGFENHPDSLDIMSSIDAKAVIEKMKFSLGKRFNKSAVN